MTLSIQLFFGNEALASQRAVWHDLFAASDCSPFMSWEWMATWHQFFGSGSDVLIARVDDDAKPVALLPLRKVPARNRFGTAMIRFLGDHYGGADHLDAIARRDEDDRTYSALARFVSGLAADGNRFSLDNMSSTSRLVPVIGTAAAGKAAFAQRSGFECPRISLSRGWEAVLSQSRRRENFRRRLRKLESRPGFCFRSVTLPGELPDAFDRFLDLHRRRWEPDGGSEISRDPMIAKFHQAVISNMSDTGSPRFDEIWLGERCVASIYGFDNGRTFYLFNAGYDLEFSALSVGMVLTGLSIRAACDRGRKAYDFLRGNEAYKFDWADGADHLIEIRCAPNSVVGRTAIEAEKVMSGIRDLAKDRLPASIRYALRKLRPVVAIGQPQTEVK